MNKINNTIIFLCTILLGCAPKEKTSTGELNNDHTEKKDSVITHKQESDYKYQILFEETLEGLQNFHIYLQTNDKSETNIGKIASELKEKLCINKCNITLYDDSSTYELVKEKRKKESDALKSINAKKLITEIDKKYYVKIAEHEIGFLEFNTETFIYYPLKDDYYDILKNQ